ncbi:MAG: tRNA (N6-threonylcarbamoyladenosine(37)-N6)-methyltransferase TrmO [Gammaproteobacteria bacterium]|nr:tRNA (N6-threonylcarbamoyladenosine(37)-N6)-methyltransferase TrmO [Gammaproteobacteria bacterium]
MEYPFQIIGIIRSCFKEKFGVPRQPGLATEARATLELQPPYDRPESLTGLEGFSHLWVVFVFHQALRDGWRPTVRPPRLGGNRRIGVFASRSPFRPNPIGLSVVALEKIDTSSAGCHLHLRGADLLDGTPVLDIKPYVPYCDALPEATAGFASAPPEEVFAVGFSEVAEVQCAAREAAGNPGLRKLIEQLLRLDPRPAYCSRRSPDEDGKPARQFGMRLYDIDLRWRVEEGRVLVTELLAVPDAGTGG